MTELTSKALLTCQNEMCNEQFIDQVDTNLEGDAVSLPSALKAHKAGWLLVEGKIFCPQCANQINNTVTH